MKADIIKILRKHSNRYGYQSVGEDSFNDVAKEIIKLFQKKPKIEKPLVIPCPECGYPTFRNNFENFRRCHGCEWEEPKSLNK